MRLQEQRKEINYQIETKVSQINSYAEQIRDLNIRIMELESIGQHAGFERQTDLLIDELSKLVRVDVTEQKWAWSQSGLMTGIWWRAKC